jgi:hypothetical protein
MQAGKIKTRGKSFARKQFKDQQLQILYTDNTNFFRKSKYEDLFKMKNKPDPVLLGT